MVSPNGYGYLLKLVAQIKIFCMMIKRSYSYRVYRVHASNNVTVAGQNEIQVEMILTYFDSQFPLSSNPNYS